MQLPVIQPLADGHARRISYLRVSLTDRCNYRCAYCMPHDEIAFLPRKQILSFEEIDRIVRVFVGLGVRRVRLTGGEPTVRAGVVDLVRLLAQVRTPDGAPLELVMTSNGHLLGKLAAPLAAAGLRAVNVSLDTLDAERFHQVTGRGELGPVLDGIEAVRAAGMALKINAVALRGINDTEIAALCRFAWERGAVPRFIEHMPMSDGMLYDVARELPAAEIRAIAERAFGAPLERADHARIAGPARYWRVAGTANEIGIISAMTEHFCADCNRVRLTAAGELHACLGYDDALSLRDLLRSGASDADLEAAIRGAAAGKRVGHEFQRTGEGAPRKHMISIGG
ncbi:MAG TPA: GTP 3',8-cyclase MoaA [Kofleriaceae bacterium]|nr:GTP 3',8-cyclase MoaA [Kofleriaceae bacterium]